MNKEYFKGFRERYYIILTSTDAYLFDGEKNRKLSNAQLMDLIKELVYNGLVLEKKLKDCENVRNGMIERYLQENTRANRFYLKNIELQKQNQNLRTKKNTIVNKIFKALLTYGIKDKYYSSEDVYFCIRETYLKEIEQECMNDTNI